MADTFDTVANGNASSVPPLTRNIIQSMPQVPGGGTVGPCLSDKALRALLDCLAAIEAG